jgi:hypothetical protein
MVMTRAGPAVAASIAALVDRSGARGLDTIAQAIGIVRYGALDPAQKIARVLVQPAARDILTSDPETFEQGRRLPGVRVDEIGRDGLTDRGLAREADDQGKQGIH